MKNNCYSLAFLFFIFLTLNQQTWARLMPYQVKHLPHRPGGLSSIPGTSFIKLSPDLRVIKQFPCLPTVSLSAACDRRWHQCTQFVIHNCPTVDEHMKCVLCFEHSVMLTVCCWSILVTWKNTNPSWYFLFVIIICSFFYSQNSSDLVSIAQGGFPLLCIHLQLSCRSGVCLLRCHICSVAFPNCRS